MQRPGLTQALAGVAATTVFTALLAWLWGRVDLHLPPMGVSRFWLEYASALLVPALVVAASQALGSDDPEAPRWETWSQYLLLLPMMVLLAHEEMVPFPFLFRGAVLVAYLLRAGIAVRGLWELARQVEPTWRLSVGAAVFAGVLALPIGLMMDGALLAETRTESLPSLLGAAFVWAVTVAVGVGVTAETLRRWAYAPTDIVTGCVLFVVQPFALIHFGFLGWRGLLLAATGVLLWRWRPEERVIGLGVSTAIVGLITVAFIGDGHVFPTLGVLLALLLLRAGETFVPKMTVPLRLAIAGGTPLLLWLLLGASGLVDGWFWTNDLGFRYSERLLLLTLDGHSGVVFVAPFVVFAFAGIREPKLRAETLALLSGCVALVLLWSPVGAKVSLPQTPAGAWLALLPLLFALFVDGLRRVPSLVQAVVGAFAIVLPGTVTVTSLLFAKGLEERPTLTVLGLVERLAEPVTILLARFIPSVWPLSWGGSSIVVVWIAAILAVVGGFVWSHGGADTGPSLTASLQQAFPQQVVVFTTVFLAFFGLGLILGPRPVPLDMEVYHPRQDITLPVNAKVDPPRAIDEIRLLSFMSNAYLLEQGTAIGAVTVTTPGGERVQRTLEVGAHSAEWAFARPDVAAAIRHIPPPVGFTLRSPGEDDTIRRIPVFDGRITFPEPIEAAEVTLTVDTDALFVLKDIKAYAPPRISLWGGARGSVRDIKTTLSQERPEMSVPLRGTYRSISLSMNLAFGIQIGERHIGDLIAVHDGSEVARLPMVAGVNIAEWAIDRPDVRRVIAHQPARPVFRDYVGRPGTAGARGRRYGDGLHFAAPTKVDGIRVSLRPDVLRDFPNVQVQVHELVTLGE